jgi:hypothetical protein
MVAVAGPDRAPALAQAHAAVHDAPMIGRLLALCGWLAWQAGAPFRATPLRRHHARVVVVLAVLLAVLATIPLIAPQLAPQPRDTVVQEIFDGVASSTGTWIRLRGRAFPLAESPTGEAGSYALLVDEANPLRAIAVRADAPVTDAPQAVGVEAFSGRLAEATVTAPEELPIEATVAGTPPRVVPDRIVELDPVATPERTVLWPLSVLPALLAVLLLIGARVGYPIFRASKTIDVLAAPLGLGERLPAAYGGVVGPSTRELADPGAALLLVRRGPKGNLLTAQPLADDGGLPPGPVTIGGSWTAGRIGEVHTVNETVPALIIRSELVNATFLFARTAERDRVAALVAIDR